MSANNEGGIEIASLRDAIRALYEAVKQIERLNASGSEKIESLLKETEAALIRSTQGPQEIDG